MIKDRGNARKLSTSSGTKTAESGIVCRADQLTLLIGIRLVSAMNAWDFVGAAMLKLDLRSA
jgi:hypothetical protein